ncbi:MAG: hypothetical protein ABJA57_02780 [Ginsengibacter sp.]
MKINFIRSIFKESRDNGGIKLENDLSFMRKARKIFLALFAACLLSASCKKDGTIDTNGNVQRMFEENILNKNFMVNLATDFGTDLTSQYSGYSFKMLETDIYYGPLIANKDGITYSGTWSTNSDFSELIITLPSTPKPFLFLTRRWRFTKKDITQMELAPWGSSNEINLHMYRL